MTTATLAADFYKGRDGCTLDVSRIANGQRTVLDSYAVADKRAARALAKSLGATPWNF